jgi:hypothetical protein
MFTVKFNELIGNEEMEIVAYNQLGEKVKIEQAKRSDKELQINISSLATGAYILNFKTKNGIVRAKILKE